MAVAWFRSLKCTSSNLSFLYSQSEDDGTCYVEAGMRFSVVVGNIIVYKVQ